MNYQQCLDFLFRSLPMYQRDGKAAYKANLDNTKALDSYFGFPHKQFKSIHIAGTNGKGSVSHMLASVFQEAGYKTALYTSPHLKDFRERIKINGKKISKEYVAKFVSDNISFFSEIKPSFFEMTATMAFRYFADEQVDIAIVETGMGGRLDSTNIIIPLLSIITNISKDHTQFLGESIEQIAAEKAGIIKENVPLVIGEYTDETKKIFNNKALEKKSKIYFAQDNFRIEYGLFIVDGKQSFNVFKDDDLIYPDLKIDLLGLYQKNNLMTVLQAFVILRSTEFKISVDNIYRGLAKVALSTGLYGRWQIIGNNPGIVCDTAHNESGIKFIIDQIKATPYKKLHIVIGMVKDKNIESMLKLFPQDALYYFTKANIPRALEAHILAAKAKKNKLEGKVIEKVTEALQEAKKNASEHDFIFVGGSTFVVAEVI